MTPARVQLARVFGFKDDHLTPVRLPARADLEQLTERIERIAGRNDASISRVNKNTWKVTQRTQGERKQYAFLPGTFSGDSTRWGPTDFYAPVQEQIIAAIQSGHDFETPWMSCKKEIISTQILRTRKGKVTVTVSVSDDFDTPGEGEATGRITKNLNHETILRKLEKLGAEAHASAEADRKVNANYKGYSVGPDKKPYPWVLTYLVNVAGDDAPSGDNYHHWGWQDVEYDEDDNPEEYPSEDQIPRDVAIYLAKKMDETMADVIRYKGYRATAWK
jgi:hypothetical protein